MAEALGEILENENLQQEKDINVTKKAAKLFAVSKEPQSPDRDSIYSSKQQLEERQSVLAQEQTKVSLSIENFKEDDSEFKDSKEDESSFKDSLLPTSLDFTNTNASSIFLEVDNSSISSQDQDAEEDWQSASSASEDELREPTNWKAGSEIQAMIHSLEKLNKVIHQQTPPQHIKDWVEGVEETKIFDCDSVENWCKSIKEKERISQASVEEKEETGDESHLFIKLNGCSARAIKHGRSMKLIIQKALCNGDVTYSFEEQNSSLVAMEKKVETILDYIIGAVDMDNSIEKSLQVDSLDIGINVLHPNSVDNPLDICLRLGWYSNEWTWVLKFTQKFRAEAIFNDKVIGTFTGSLVLASNLLAADFVKKDYFNRKVINTVFMVQNNDTTLLNREKGDFMRRDLPRLAVKPSDKWAASIQVKGWGNNQFGELGVGDHNRCLQPTPIPFFGILDYCKVSCVSVSEFHCIALTDVGLVYTWGNGSDGALGHGDLNDQLYPKLLSSFPNNKSDPVLAIMVACGSHISGCHSACVGRDGIVYTWGLGTTLGTNTTKSISNPQPLDKKSFDDCKIDYISCGGGFTVAVASTGGVYSFGDWSNGRLGLGRPLTRQGNRRRTRQSNEKKAVMRYMLTPKKVQGDIENVDIVVVDCGEAHTLALSSAGHLYSWGRGSSGQLGNGELVDLFSPKRLQYGLNERFCSNITELSILPTFKLISCGGNHSIAMSTTGRVYTWGAEGGNCLGHGEFSQRNTSKLSILRTEDDSRAENELGKKYAGNQQQKNILLRPRIEQEQPWRWPRLNWFFQGKFPLPSSISAGKDASTVVTCDGRAYQWRNQSSQFGPELITSLRDDFVQDVFSGGSSTFVLSSGMTLGFDLRSSFLKFVQNEKLAKSFGADIVILVGAEELWAHKAILSTRSSYFRNRIQLEERSNIEVTRLLLSETSFENALLLLEYIYGDNVFYRLDSMSTTANDLKMIAHIYELKRLESICAHSLGNSENDEIEEERDDENLLDKLIPASGMEKDLELLINNAEYADVKFITSDKCTVYAHRVLLLTRSPYFHEMFTSKRQTKIDNSGKFQKKRVIQVQVPDSKPGLLRILRYIYTGFSECQKLQEKEILDDLLSCKRYKLDALGCEYETSVPLSTSNCIRLLEISEHVSASKLKMRLILFIAHNLERVTLHKYFQKFQQKYPELMQEILTSAKTINDQARTSLVQQDDEDDLAEEGPTSFTEYVKSLPWFPITLFSLCILVYRLLLFDPSVLEYVPIINGLCFAIAFGIALYQLSS